MSPVREAIDKVLVQGEPLRNIAKRVSISPAALQRHKNHIAQAIVTASEQRGEQLGDTMLDEIRRVQRKAWELLAKTESESDHRGSIVALREVRECLKSLGEMLAKADSANGGREHEKDWDLSLLSDEELRQVTDILEKAYVGPGPWGARIAKG
jgi:transposase